MTDDAACACLPSFCSLVVDVSVWVTSPLPIVVRCVFCGFFFFFLSFLLIMLPSGIPKLPHRPACGTISYCVETSPSSLPPEVESPFLNLIFCLSFCLFYFDQPPFEENGLPFWEPGVLCLCSKVVLWKLLNIQWSFYEFVGEKVVSLSYFSAILGQAPFLILLIWAFCLLS